VGPAVVSAKCASPPTCHFGQVRALQAFPILSNGEAYAAIRLPSPGTSPLFRAEADPYTCVRLDRPLQGILVKKKKTTSSPKKTARAKSAKDFPAVFAALKKILNPYEKHLSVVRYKPEFYYLETLLPCYKGKPVCFGAVRMGKNYVSYYLMPVYMNPELRKRISPELKKRMQGKSCFNFKEIDPVLFRELTALTAAGFKGFLAKKLI
jgi:hypothetical protein